MKIRACRPVLVMITLFFYSCGIRFYNPFMGNTIGLCFNEEDKDGDGICNIVDNCPDHHNPDQLDSNADGIGDVCTVNKGNMDEIFAAGGEFLFESALGNDYALDAAVDNNGSIFVTGYISNGKDSDLFLMKLKNGGSLDTDFNSTGYITRSNIAGGNAIDAGCSVTMAPDGDLLVCGISGSTLIRKGFLWKVSTSGTDDTDFGTSGTFLLDDEVDIEFLKAKCDGNGKIVLVGDCNPGGIYYPGVWRIKADGSGLDPLFNHPVNGIIYNSGRGYSNTVCVNPDNTISVAGICNSGGIGDDGCSWLIDTNGNIVTLYGNPLAHGELAGGSNNDYWASVKYYPGNRLILGGSSDSQFNGQDEVVARINLSDGSFDTSFGNGDGFWTEDVLALGELGRVIDVIVQDDGSVIAALEVRTTPDNFNVALIRLDPDGNRDLNYASGAGIIMIGDDYTERSPTIVRQPDGKILILSGKEDSGGDYDIVVWRVE